MGLRYSLARTDLELGFVWTPFDFGVHFTSEFWIGPLAHDFALKILLAVSITITK